MTIEEINKLPLWEREKLFTDRDRQAIQRAINSSWTEIDLSWAETEAGRCELKSITSRKYHNDEFLAGIQ